MKNKKGYDALVEANRRAVDELSKMLSPTEGFFKMSSEYTKEADAYIQGVVDCSQLVEQQKWQQFCQMWGAIGWAHVASCFSHSLSEAFGVPDDVEDFVQRNFLK